MASVPLAIGHDEQCVRIGHEGLRRIPKVGKGLPAPRVCGQRVRRLLLHVPEAAQAVEPCRVLALMRRETRPRACHVARGPATSGRDATRESRLAALPVAALLAMPGLDGLPARAALGLRLGGPRPRRACGMTY